MPGADGDVIAGTDGLRATGEEKRSLFVAWLQANRPELHIGPTTTWQPTLVAPQVAVVAHYLFYSDEWEMAVSWHVMIAPYDWVILNLRKRKVDWSPSEAFRINSVTAGDVPAPETPSDVIVR